METLSFIVGAGMVVGILAVVFAVRFYKEFQTLKEQTQNYIESDRDTIRNIWEQIDRIEHGMNRRFEESYRLFNSSSDEIYRQMDSRFDKFENKISKKQVLND